MRKYNFRAFLMCLWFALIMLYFLFLGLYVCLGGGVGLCLVCIGCGCGFLFQLCVD